MRKIIISLSVIAVAAAVVIGGTYAFFSDQETSTGNTFTAGAIDLKVDSQQHYNNAVCVNGNWALEPGATPTNPQYPVIGTDCGGTWGQNTPGVDITSEKFFDFADIKPGDSGENTISLHVINNDAWVCAAVANLASNDVSQTEPESQAVLDTDDMASGELDDTMVWTVWRDNASTNGAVPGDNIHQDGEQILASGHPVNGMLALYDSQTGTGALPGGTTGYLGVSWSLPSATGNEVQTDSLTGDISFTVVQSRNNPGYVCGQSQEQRPTVGAALDAYTAPTACDVNVPSSGITTIQQGVDAASAGQTVCVAAGTYTENVNVNKDITLAGAGALVTTLNNSGSAGSGTMSITASGATVEGLTINNTSGLAAVYISGARNGITLAYNDISKTGPGTWGNNALLTDAGQTNHTIINNVFGGSAAQLVYVNGMADVGTASDNVNFTSNTFGGTATGPILANNADNSEMTLNKFTGTPGGASPTFGTFATGNSINQNNFNSSAGLEVSSVNALNAENNWWGDTDPSDNVAGLVDYTPFEASAFPQN